MQIFKKLPKNNISSMKTKINTESQTRTISTKIQKWENYLCTMNISTINMCNQTSEFHTFRHICGIENQKIIQMTYVSHLASIANLAISCIFKLQSNLVSMSPG